LEVKIIDFGFAQEFDKEIGMNLVLGSPLYMAPELVKKEIYNEKVDIWALGCITHLMLVGETPF
jgi:serine/threonine protein kinase